MEGRLASEIAAGDIADDDIDDIVDDESPAGEIAACSSAGSICKRLIKAVEQYIEADEQYKNDPTLDGSLGRKLKLAVCVYAAVEDAKPVAFLEPRIDFLFVHEWTRSALEVAETLKFANAAVFKTILQQAKADQTKTGKCTQNTT